MRPLFVSILCLLLVTSAAAKPLAPADVPDPLKPWLTWVLSGHEDRVCPFRYDDDSERRCAWPTRLELNLQDRQGSFRMQWDVQTESRSSLPGDATVWPQDVQIDGAPARFAGGGESPTLLLLPGSHTVTGRFLWDRLPENLQVPRDSGLISLSVNGRTIADPRFNEQGQLWIGGGPVQGTAEIANRLDVQIFRKIDDDIPLRLATRIRIDSAGQQRELLLAGGLLPGSVPLSLTSPLPARLEPDGRLRLQVRPGHWEINLVARYPGEVSRLELPAHPAEPWPAEEIWTYQAQAHLRIAEIEGVPAMDPQQTNLPEEWKTLPAFRVAAGEAMSFRVLRRGDPDPEPDALNLQREIWLDFDGGGYTLSDRIEGKMTRDWRINSASGLQPGRVLVNGQPQSITRLEAAAAAGVELRRGQVEMNADSRLDNNSGSIPASGWDKDFRSVGATLHLPPGWRLWAATGVDEAPGTWVGRWTLLDFFVVLIATVMAVRLHTWRAALIALPTLALLWQEPGAPCYAWLNLLFGIVLLRVLPAGKPAFWARIYRNLAIAILLLIALPFLADQIRLGLYPQLERPWVTPPSGDFERGFAASPPPPAAPAPADQPLLAPEPAAEAPMAAMDSAMQRSQPTERLFRRGPLEGGSASGPKYRELDPSAITQTGPGRPHWTWESFALRWNGPVLAGQTVGLYLQSPSLGLWLNLMRVGLTLGFAYLLLRSDFRNSRKNDGMTTPSSPGTAASTALAFLLAGIVAGLQPTVARADLPDPALLEQLRQRLLESPDCLPRCAEIPRLRLILSGGELRQELEIHADQPVAVPLPARERLWLPERVELNGAPAGQLSRDAEGGLRLGVKAGHHRVILSGGLPAREQIQIPLPLRPKRVDWEGSGWSVDGIQENGVPDIQLQLSRLAVAGPQAAANLEAKPLPPFLEITRTLRLGLDWQVSTQVRRLSPEDAPVVAEIPVLEGESVTTQGWPVKNGKVLVNLVAGQSSLEWESILEKREALVLKAPETSNWVEVWRVDVSPIWHLATEGLVVAHHQDAAGNWLPEWHPWPGESVQLRLTRPEGVPGATLTIDSSNLTVTTGERATDASLSLSLRSSQGGQHSIRLPEGAVLQSAQVNGQTQPLRPQDGVVPIPIRPGTQSVNLTWRLDQGASAHIAGPAVDLGIASVNASVSINLSRDRWVLLAGGPKLGPAVLIWGVLAVILLAAAGLGRLNLTPLRFHHWALLLIGLSQIEIAETLLVAGWLLALGWRGKHGAEWPHARFDALQVGLALLTPLAVLLLFHSVQQGLLGFPEMQVAGNNSTAYQLHWYQDRSPAQLPQPLVVSAPLWLYRTLMLLWALWLAFALVDWLRWGWRCWTIGGLWRPLNSTAP